MARKRKMKSDPVPVENLQRFLFHLAINRHAWLCSIMSWAHMETHLLKERNIPATEFGFPRPIGEAPETDIYPVHHFGLLCEENIESGFFAIKNNAQERRVIVQMWLLGAVLSSVHNYYRHFKVELFYKQNNLNLGLFNFLNGARVITVHHNGKMNKDAAFQEAQWRDVKIIHNDDAFQIDSRQFNLFLYDLFDDLIKAIRKCSGKINIQELLPAADVPAVQKEIMDSPLVKRGEPLVRFPGIPWDLHSTLPDKSG